VTKLVSFKEFNEGSSIEGFIGDMAHMAVRGLIGKYRRNKMAKAQSHKTALKHSPTASKEHSADFEADVHKKMHNDRVNAEVKRRQKVHHDDQPARMSADEYRKEVGLKPRVPESMMKQRQAQSDADSNEKLHKHFADKYGPNYKDKHAQYKQKEIDRKIRIQKSQDDATNDRIAKDREKTRVFLASKLKKNA
jgi:hypothetical protein